MPEGGPKVDFATIAAPGIEPTNKSIFQNTAEYNEQFAFWLEQRGLHIPITQVIGFQQFTANLDTQAGSSTTSSTTYADLADGAHPVISGLSSGRYVLFFGSSSSGSGVHKMGIQVNSTAPTSDLEIETSGGGYWAAIVTLTADNNTLTAKYKGSDGSSVTWTRRYLFALRYGN